MSPKTWATADGALNASLSALIVQLARTASVEINVPDVKHLEASRALLAPGTRVYVSHLPRQQWQDTEAACRAVHAAGLYPVPHIPARLLPDTAMLEQMLASLAGNAGVKEVLLIAGDHPVPLGPYACVSDILHSGLLNKHGYQRVSLAGHPEGHPKVALEVIRRAELEKVQLAAEAGLDATFLTQFFFESAPFLQWSSELRAQGVRARLVGGLAGPAGLATLFKYAVRCGAGPSIRALGARPSSFLKLMGDHGPESVVCELAAARAATAVTRPETVGTRPATGGFTGIHLFCFGGYLRTCEWLRAVMDGRFNLNHAGGFTVAPLT